MQVELRCEDVGTGLPVVLLHAFPLSSAMWSAQREALSADYRVLNPDQRGFGGSPLGDDEPSLDAVADDVVALLDVKAIDRAVVGGLSMGGFVAMRMAARRPDLVRSLILLETSSDPEPVENIAQYRLLTKVVRYIGTWPVRAKVSQIMLGKTILTERARHSDVQRFTELMMRRRDVWRAVNGVIDRAGIHEELSRITTPTVILVGDEDVATPRIKAEKIASAIAHARVVTIPRAGHSSSVEEPRAVTSAIESFLAAFPNA